MLDITFIVSSFTTALILGFTVGKQILVFKRAVEISTSG